MKKTEQKLIKIITNEYFFTIYAITTGILLLFVGVLTDSGKSLFLINGGIGIILLACFSRMMAESEKVYKWKIENKVFDCWTKVYRLLTMAPIVTGYIFTLIGLVMSTVCGIKFNGGLLKLLFTMSAISLVSLVIEIGRMRK